MPTYVVYHAPTREPITRVDSEAPLDLATWLGERRGLEHRGEPIPAKDLAWVETKEHEAREMTGTARLLSREELYHALREPNLTPAEKIGFIHVWLVDRKRDQMAMQALVAQDGFPAGMFSFAITRAAEDIAAMRTILSGLIQEMR